MKFYNFASGNGGGEVGGGEGWGGGVLGVGTLLLPWRFSCPPLCLWPSIVLKDHPDHLTKYEVKGTEISIFKLFTESGKCNLGFSKIPISNFFYELGKTWKSTQPQTNISKSKC